MPKKNKNPFGKHEKVEIEIEEDEGSKPEKPSKIRRKAKKHGKKLDQTKEMLDDILKGK